ncbi:MAG: PLP-dependent aminotransferase family protein [Oscillospiraceae bacterium]|nr:PLP-dependent aminotransferase family protein [Oscillospiraceae bacterium]
MLYDFLVLNKNSAVPLYEQLYTGLKQGVETGRLPPGERLASIRQAAGELSLSRTTVETAYARLCLEGYAEARPQSGYRVRGILPRPQAAAETAAFLPRYDFSTSSIGPDAADLQNWKRLMRAVLADSGAVVSYGDAQGEAALRRALSSYAFSARGVLAEPENIFIGAGVGPLLHLLCPLFSSRLPVWMEASGFFQAEQIFFDYGFPVQTGGASFCLPNTPAIVMELPSLRPRETPVAVSARRTALHTWAQAEEQHYVIEDDYNGELRYRTRPLPAFQGLCPDKTIYLGSFSKLLLPSVRIAYMVLPPPLAQKARARLAMLNQTAGKTEQLALAEYIRTGLLEKHLRRLRRLYAQKSQLIAEALDKTFGAAIQYTLRETYLSFSVTLAAACTGETLEKLAREHQILCRAQPPAPSGLPRVALGFSGIPAASIPAGVSALYTAFQKVLL